MDWELSPENRALLERVTAQIQRLQKELGIQPMTLEERSQAYQRRQEELKKLAQIASQRRPPPKWKV